MLHAWIQGEASLLLVGQGGHCPAEMVLAGAVPTAVPLAQEHGAFSTGIPTSATMGTDTAGRTCSLTSHKTSWLAAASASSQGQDGTMANPAVFQKGRCWVGPTGAPIPAPLRVKCFGVPPAGVLRSQPQLS